MKVSETFSFGNKYLRIIHQNCSSKIFLGPTRITENSWTTTEQVIQNNIFHATDSIIVRLTIIAQYPTDV